MPQMFPLNWILLYLLFTIIFIFFNIMNYFNISLLKKPNNLIIKSKISTNWKW